MAEHHFLGRAGHAADLADRALRPDRDEINRARQAAEALFAPKRPIIEQSSPTTTPSPDQMARKPRILSAVVQAQPAHVEPTEVPIAPVPPKSTQRIPASHLGRIRACMKYGMTMAQVAEVYGVTIGDIERMLYNA